MTAQFEIKNLVFTRDKGFELFIPSLKISKGERIAMSGPNGAGKSSLLEIIGLLDKPHKGEIYFNEVRVNKSNVFKFRRKISYLAQKPNLFNMSVYENVSLPLKFRKMDKEKVRAKTNHWLERLGVEHLSNRRARTLSGGEAQKVALARMMVSDPEVLLFDEPLNALDKKSKLDFREVLNGLLCQSDKTVVYVSHNIKEVEGLITRKLSIKNGRII